MSKLGGGNTRRAAVDYWRRELAAAEAALELAPRRDMRSWVSADRRVAAARAGLEQAVDMLQRLTPFGKYDDVHI
jgi:hypothetical protein